MKHIELSDVSFIDSHRIVLDGVTAAFKHDRLTAILGSSGSGKSTLLQLILGIIRPTSGDIVIDGERRSFPLSTRQRFKFGYVIQGNGLFPHLTVAENIALPGKIAKLSAKASNERVEMLLELGGLHRESRNRFPYQLSQPEQLKVLICRAYFPDPDALLMDEPFSAIPPAERAMLQKEFVHFQKAYPRTVLLVTHDLAEACQLADDILILDQGKVQQFGPRQKVLQRPANLRVQHVLQAALSS
jgi:osmoprotectant transport system ATP-binding protein